MTWEETQAIQKKARIKFWLHVAHILVLLLDQVCYYQLEYNPATIEESMPQEQKVVELTTKVFFMSYDQILMPLILMVYNLDYFKFWVLQISLSTFQVAWIYFKFDLIIWQVMMQALVLHMTVNFLGYCKIYYTKVLFATQNTLKRMYGEQY